MIGIWATVLIFCAAANVLGAIFIYRAATYNQKSTALIGECLVILKDREGFLEYERDILKKDNPSLYTALSVVEREPDVD